MSTPRYPLALGETPPSTPQLESDTPQQHRYPIDRSQFAVDLNRWFARHGRVLPWRDTDTSAWAILVSEVMSQQTPVARVIPLWEAWLKKWPTPADLAVAPKAEVLRMWANLGYPRRALRLQECARDCVERHGGDVPRTVAELEALSGIGSYTARAVAAFAYGQAVPVVDTNVRRVLHRAVFGNYLQGPARARDLADVAELMPWVDDDPSLARRHFDRSHHQPHAREDARMMTASLMELGALICRAKSPQCDQCPVRQHCQWIALGKPAPTAEQKASAAKRVQKFAGTDRQVRGKVMGLLRASQTSSATSAEIDLLWPDKVQLKRAVDSLVNDGLAERIPPDREGNPSKILPAFATGESITGLRLPT